MKYLVKGGFQCDRQSKYDLTASTVEFIEQWRGNNNVTLIFKELDKNGNEVVFDSDDSSATAPTDLIMYYNNKRYVIEIKERWGKYTSDYYGKESDEEGWMLNIDKVDKLKAIDAIPLYINLFPDGVVRIWNLNKINSFNTITKNIHKKTVVKSDVIAQQRYEVWNKDATTIKRVTGSKSNGIWVS